MAAEALAQLPPDQQFEICAKFIETGGDDGKGTGVPSMLGQGQKERLECEPPPLPVLVYAHHVSHACLRLTSVRLQVLQAVQVWRRDGHQAVAVVGDDEGGRAYRGRRDADEV